MKNYQQKIVTAAAVAATYAGSVTAHAAAITIPGNQMKSLGTPPDANEFANFFGGFKTFGTAVSGFCAITSLIFFVISIAKLSTSAGNDMQRSRAIKQILYSGIALALFGGITVFASIFWNLI